MGINKGLAKLLLKEASRRPFEGQVLTLGKQDITTWKRSMTWTLSPKTALTAEKHETE